jgi:heavy metal translocating P-type ATPase
VFLLLSESGLLEGDYKSSSLYQTSLKLGIISNPTDAAPVSSSPPSLDGTRELVLQIDGMWCSSCSWLIEKVVGGEKGVAQANVMYASDTARIHYRPEVTSPEAISASIEKLGYHTADRDADSDHRAKERRSLLIRMGVALFLMNNIMFFSYVIYVGYFQDLATEMKSLVPWVLLGFTTPAVLWCGLPIHRKAWASLKNGAPTMELLFSIGIFASFVYSIHEMFVGGDHFYFDTAASLVALLLVGKFLELMAKQGAAEGVKRLYQMLPKKVRILAPEGERLVSIEKLMPGDSFVVKSGEKIPADGVILEGNGTVDESLLTGESKPLVKKPGDSVIASSMNVNGHLTIQATVIGEGTVLSGIIRMVEEAISSKSGLERVVDRIARIFIPAVVVFSVAAGALNYAFGGSVEEALLRTITILVIACPCVLGMATPLALAAGIGYATRQGILIRDGETLQRLAAIDTVVFDKTGTITRGKFSLAECRPGNLGETEFLRLVGGLEQASSHPIALAVVEACLAKAIETTTAKDVLVADGKGLSGTVDGLRVTIGTESFVQSAGYHLSDGDAEFARAMRTAGNTVVVAGIEGNTSAGILVLGDELKQGVADAVGACLTSKLHVSLLSGDSGATTAAVASRIGIDDFTGDMLPGGKIGRIAELQSAGRRVAMIGDGVNDAPALAKADVGIAMGNGTEIAVASSGVTLLRDDPALVREAILIARRTVVTMKQNLVWAFFYNSIGLVLAAMGLINPLLAAGAMLVSSLSVVLNSTRLREEEGHAWKQFREILFPWWEPGQ